MPCSSSRRLMRSISLMVLTSVSGTDCAWDEDEVVIRKVPVEGGDEHLLHDSSTLRRGLCFSC